MKLNNIIGKRLLKLKKISYLPNIHRFVKNNNSLIIDTSTTKKNESSSLLIPTYPKTKKHKILKKIKINYNHNVNSNSNLLNNNNSFFTSKNISRKSNELFQSAEDIIKQRAKRYIIFFT